MGANGVVRDPVKTSTASASPPLTSAHNVRDQAF